MGEAAFSGQNNKSAGNGALIVWLRRAVSLNGFTTGNRAENRPFEPLYRGS
ncbi:hypothetical protein GCM10020370_07740 [Paenibacillus hodogayensis]